MAYGADSGAQLSPFMMSALLDRQGRGGGAVPAPIVPNMGAEMGSGMEASNLLKQQQIKTTQDMMALQQQQTIKRGVDLLAQTKGQGPLWSQYAQKNPGTAKALQLKQTSDQLDMAQQKAKAYQDLYKLSNGDLASAQALATTGPYKGIIDPASLGTDAGQYALRTIGVSKASNAFGMVQRGMQILAADPNNKQGQQMLQMGQAQLNALSNQRNSAAAASQGTAAVKQATAPTVQPLAQAKINEENANANKSTAQANQANAKASGPQFNMSPAAGASQALAIIKNLDPKIPTAQAQAIAVEAHSEAMKNSKNMGDYGPALQAAVVHQLKGYNSGGMFGSSTYTPQSAPQGPVPDSASLQYIKDHPNDTKAIQSFTQHYGHPPNYYNKG